MFRRRRLRAPMGTPASQRVSPMAESFHLREQAARCRRLARDSTDPNLRDSLLRLAEEYTARANAHENDDTAVWRAGSEDDGAA
jgi:hypothetical protein